MTPLLTLLAALWLILSICFSFFYRREPNTLVLATVITVLVILVWYFSGGSFAIR